MNTNIDELSSAQSYIKWVVDYYQSRLLVSSESLHFLQAQGFNELAKLNIGFCDRSLGSQLPSRSQSVGKKVRKRLRVLGILNAKGWEVFHGSVIFPIIIDNDVIGIYGHKILSQSKLRKSSPAETLVMFNDMLMGQHCFSQSEAVLVFNHYRDAFLFQQYEWITTVFNGSDESLKLFEGHQFRRVILVQTSNQDIDNAQHTLLNNLSKRGISVWQCRLPEYWFSLLQRASKKELIETWIQQSVSLNGEGEFIIQPQDSEQSLGFQYQRFQPLSENAGDLWLDLNTRQYRIRMHGQNQSKDSLKINLLLQTEVGFFVDIIDLYQAKQRLKYSKLACIDCRVDEREVRKDLGQIILSLEHYQVQTSAPVIATQEMSDKDKFEAIDWLHNKSLIDVLQSELGAVGIVGERNNRMVAYLACVSRLLSKPLAILVQSSSSAGKSLLMDAVLRLMPKGAQYSVSTLTGQSLYYMGKDSLRHKILCVAEEEGVSQASYALKLLQSQGEVTIASTSHSKDSGQMSTSTYTVTGPVMLFLTSTSIQIDEELLNRCLVLTVNESHKQTQQIHQYQRYKKTFNGWQSELKIIRLINKHHNVQRLLKSYKVINPFAESLSFIDNQTRTRRDHEKYLTLIESITLLYQFQRPIKKLRQGKEVIEYIEVTPEDIYIANKLAKHIFIQTLDDMSPQTRQCLNLIDGYVKEQKQHREEHCDAIYFTRRDICEFTHLSHTQVHTHCKRLEAQEYLLPVIKSYSKSKYYLLNYSHDNEQKQLINHTFDFYLDHKEAQNMQADSLKY
jgi:DNA primase